jgi:hypothetical protein
MHCPPPGLQVPTCPLDGRDRRILLSFSAFSNIGPPMSLILVPPRSYYPGKSMHSVFLRPLTIKSPPSKLPDLSSPFRLLHARSHISATGWLVLFGHSFHREQTAYFRMPEILPISYPSQNKIPQQARKRDGRLEPKKPQEFEIRYPET